jgi:hypothetical protein
MGIGWRPEESEAPAEHKFIEVYSIEVLRCTYLMGL